MSLELRPLGVSCNIACAYCYQNPQRGAGNVARSYDWEAMKATIEREGRDFSLFGGEPLLVPKADLERIWSYGLERFGANSLQTNGALIDEEHLALFKRYKVSVGISLDGPGELNDARRAGTLERTREAAARAHAAVERLCREGIPPSLIVTLHKGNASRRRLPRLRDWILELERLGVRSARLHILESDHPSVREHLALSEDENVRAFMCLAALERRLTTLRLDVFDDMRRMLRGEDRETTCVWNACDPYTTRAVQGVEGDGRMSNCGRTNKDGIEFLKSRAQGFERYRLLHGTPQEDGGCRGCRFFLMCKGQCPGTAIDGDWRNRTEHCGVWKRLYGVLEREMERDGVTPLSRDARRTALEAAMLAAWKTGRNPAIQDLLEAKGPARAAGAEGASVRLMWVSERARETWKPRIEAAAEAFREAWWGSVARGERAGVTAWLTAAETAALARRLERRGLTVTASSARVAALPDGGRAVVLRALVASAREAARFARAERAGDRETVRRMRGIPECCERAPDGPGDEAWEMTGADGNASRVDVTGPALLNPLWKPMGLTALPYRPCRFDCAPSAEAAVRLEADVAAMGRGEALDWARAVLGWSAEWSALHGAAELRTPILKLCAPAAAWPRARVLRYRGAGYPEEGGRSPRFPYRR